MAWRRTAWYIKWPPYSNSRKLGVHMGHFRVSRVGHTPLIHKMFQIFDLLNSSVGRTQNRSSRLFRVFPKFKLHIIYFFFHFSKIFWKFLWYFFFVNILKIYLLVKFEKNIFALEVSVANFYIVQMFDCFWNVSKKSSRSGLPDFALFHDIIQ